MPNIPWEEKPKGYNEPMWRYSKNPITGWYPTAPGARVYNSAVLPHEGKFIGAFRADHKNGRANLHFGRSNDGFSFEKDKSIIQIIQGLKPRNLSLIFPRENTILKKALK